jgi:hypothetical protein
MDLDSASPKEAQAGSENDFVPREDDGTLLSYDSLSFFFFPSNHFSGPRLIHSYSWAKPVKFLVNFLLWYIQNMPVIFVGCTSLRSSACCFEYEALKHLDPYIKHRFLNCCFIIPEHLKH